MSTTREVHITHNGNSTHVAAGRSGVSGFTYTAITEGLSPPDVTKAVRQALELLAYKGLTPKEAIYEARMLGAKQAKMQRWQEDFQPVANYAKGAPNLPFDAGSLRGYIFDIKTESHEAALEAFLRIESYRVWGVHVVGKDVLIRAGLVRSSTLVGAFVTVSPWKEGNEGVAWPVEHKAVGEDDSIY